MAMGWRKALLTIYLEKTGTEAFGGAINLDNFLGGLDSND